MMNNSSVPRRPPPARTTSPLPSGGNRLATMAQSHFSTNHSVKQQSPVAPRPVKPPAVSDPILSRLPPPSPVQSRPRTMSPIPSGGVRVVSTQTTTTPSPAPVYSGTVSVASTAVSSQPSQRSSSMSKAGRDANDWRKHGKRYRAELLLADEEKGGSTFEVHSNCAIERYYRVAERVLEQFLSTAIRQTSEMTESYLVGSRLVKFFSILLPSHPEYFSTEPALEELRKKSQGQLVELLQYLEELALHIDQVQYNKYMTRDLTPEEKDLFGALTATTPKASKVVLDMHADNTRATPSAPPPTSTEPAASPLHVNHINDSFVSQSTCSTLSTKLTAAEPAASTSRMNHINDSFVSESSGSTLSIKPIPSEPGPSTARVNHTNDSFVSESSCSTLSVKEPETLQERVARVVQVTEAYSETLGTIQPMPAITNRSRRMSRSPSPMGRKHSQQKPPVSKHNDHTTSIRRSASVGGTPVTPEKPVRSTNPFDNDWEDPADVYTPEGPSTHARIDLLEESSLPPTHKERMPNTPSTTSTHTTESSDSSADKVAATHPSSNRNIPKLKGPPKFHSRTLRAKVAESYNVNFPLESDDPYQREEWNDEDSDPVQAMMASGKPKSASALYKEYRRSRRRPQAAGAQLYSTSIAGTGVNGGAMVFTDDDEDDAGIPFKSKIEERWEQAQQEGNLNDSIDTATPEEAEMQRLEDQIISTRDSSHKTILGHFKGCVQCLIDAD
eukprot:Nitzschia sp. Nitz4//scaffold333_size18811//15939//18204//NITZ4_008758-RA/size18811-augustus-gene-0.42-mRNA-1//-1//CDS//3329548238//1360//frame0